MTIYFLRLANPIHSKTPNEWGTRSRELKLVA